MIPDCVYLWRRVTETDQESLSMRRKEAWNYIDRIDSYEMNLDFYTDFDKNYFKKLMRRVIYPIEGIINNEEFENVFFERGVSLLKRECPKVDDLYENDMTVLENLYLYLSLNDLRDEIKEVIINNDDYRDLVDIDGKTYWNMPLFRNEELKIPDEIFEVKSLMSNFIDIEQLSSDGEYIRFKNVRLPKYLDVESAEIFFMERIGVDEVLDENFKSYKLVESDERNVFNLNIPIEDLNLFQIHDAYLQANYKSKSTNKVRIKEKCIGAIENGNDKLNIYATKNQRNIAISSSLYDKFRFELVSDDLGMTMINRSEGNLKREMPIFIKDLKTRGFVKFLFDKNLSEDNIKWTELDGKGNYGFYLSTFKNGRIKMGVPMKKSNLIDFKDMEIGNIRLYEDNKGNIRFDIL